MLERCNGSRANARVIMIKRQEWQCARHECYTKLHYYYSGSNIIFFVFVVSIFVLHPLPFVITEPFVLANYVTAFHAVVYHPQEPRFLATANAKEGIALWDVRAPKR